MFLGVQWHLASEAQAQTEPLPSDPTGVGLLAGDPRERRCQLDARGSRKADRGREPNCGVDKKPAAT
jgi:hypothetical protein